jgi:heptosyltransferase III
MGAAPGKASGFRPLPRFMAGLMPPAAMPKLLFITSTRIGDAVLSTSALAEARALAPGARVTIACGPLAAPLFRAEPDLDAIITMPKQKRSGHWFALLRTLKGQRFDLAVDLRGSATTYIVPTKKRFVFRSRKRAGHKLDEFAALFRKDAPREMIIHLDERAIGDATAFAGNDKPLFVLGANSNWNGKTWARENFAQLARRVAGTGQPLAGARIILLGGPEDAADLAALEQDLNTNGFDVRVAAGALDLLACAALLKRAALYVGNDSGLMHLSGAMRAPTLGLFGPTDERVYGPRGPKARTVRGAPYETLFARIDLKAVPQVSLMGDLTVDAVETAAREMLAQ